MDEFAQSREDDDLFADDFEPVANDSHVIQERVRSEHVAPVEQPPVTITHSSAIGGTSAKQPPTGPREQQRGGRREGGRGQGRGQEGRGGRGRGGNVSNGLNQSRYAPKVESSTAPARSVPPPAAAPIVPAPTQEPTNTQSDAAVNAASDSTNGSTTTPTTAPQFPQPAQPTASQPDTRTHAVRGDRSATGGPAHKKLTEEELSAKMEKMAILNAQKAEAHRISEADQASYQHREKELAKERREKAVVERKNERVMEMERAKNRERKMKAQGGREWDSEKVEADMVDKKGRSSEFVRGGFGGVINSGSRGGGLAGSRFSGEEGQDGNTGEEQASGGRGGFEIRGRGRGGRGGRGGKAQNTVPGAEDFPSLPSAKPSEAAETAPAPTDAKTSNAPKPIDTTHTDLTPSEKVTSPGEMKPAGDWAEEMATPSEEKKMEL